MIGEVYYLNIPLRRPIVQGLKVITHHGYGRVRVVSVVKGKHCFVHPLDLNEKCQKVMSTFFEERKELYTWYANKEWLSKDDFPKSYYTG